jgi:cation diffusion facilitator family transporter
MNATSAVCCATSCPFNSVADEVSERRQANRAIAVSALGLALTGLIELAIALISGSVALFGDAVHNLSDGSTSAAVFLGFRASRKTPSKRHPYGYERAEDLAGVGVALMIWANAVVAGFESVTKLLDHGSTDHLSWGIAAAAVGIAGNQHPDTTIAQADQIGHQVATALTPQIPEMRNFTWTARGLLTDSSTTPHPHAALAASTGPHPPP